MGMFRRIRSLGRRSQLDREIKAELQAHIAMRTEHNLAAGMSPREAARDARVRFGNPTATQERVHAADAALLLENLWLDLRYALRQLRRSPGFAVTVIATLALGIGANLAVFQLLYGVLLAQLPVPHPEQLYALHAVRSPFDGDWSFSYGAYQRLVQASGGAMSPITARSGSRSGYLQEGNGPPTPAVTQMVSGNFFSVLGVAPYAGRLFTVNDDRQGQSEWPVVLRYGFAKEHFGLMQATGSSLLGRRCLLNSVPVVVVGVTNERFLGVMKGSAPDVWIPIEAQATSHFGTGFDSLGPGYGIELGRSWLDQQGIFWLWLTARVPEGQGAISGAKWMGAFQTDIAFLAAAAKDPHIREQILHAQMDLHSVAGGEGALGARYSKPLIVLMTMAGLIFLVGCLNLANLQLARLSGRQREIALRISLGATRWRVLRQVLVEDMLLALTGGGCALLTGRLASTILLHWASGRNSTIPLDLHIDFPLILLGAGLLAGSLLAFSLLPAWWITGRGFAAASGSQRGAAADMQSRAASRWSSLLLAGQVSLSLALVGMAGLFGQTLLYIAETDAGMDREHVLSVHLDLNRDGVAGSQADFATIHKGLLDSLTALPDVRSATMQSCSIPRCGWNTAFHVFGQPARTEEQLHGEENHVGLNYFQTLGIPLLRGRDFASSDRVNTTHVVIFNEAYAKKLFGAENPVGRWVGYEPPPNDHKFLVVGVVGNARVDGLRVEPPPVAYMTLNQTSDSANVLEVRVAGDPGAHAQEIRHALLSYRPDLAIEEIVALNTEFSDGLTTEKLLARLTQIFGLLSLALAALGFYGLLSFRVSRRTSEIGIRIALGASKAQVQRLIFRQTGGILLAGVIPGILLTETMSRAARGILDTSAKTDGLMLLGAVLMLAVVAMIATFLPARRAAGVDPMVSLRCE